MLLLALQAPAQNDSTALNPEFGIRDGLYLSYDDLRHNRMIIKEDLVSKENKEQLEFISKVLTAEKFVFNNNGSEVTMESKQVWGFFQNNTFYVNYKGEFYRVPVFGAISFFVASVRVVAPSYYDPRFGYMGGGTTYELREFLLDYYNGQVRDFSMSAVDELISRDAELHKEFKALGRSKQKKQFRLYLRRCNEKHLVYVLK